MSGKPTAAAAHRIKQGSLCNSAIRNACSLPVYASLAHVDSCQSPSACTLRASMRAALNIPGCLKNIAEPLLHERPSQVVLLHTKAANAALDINVLPLTKRFAAQTACLTCLMAITEES